jgi:hypothetical protein
MALISLSTTCETIKFVELEVKTQLKVGKFKWVLRGGKLKIELQNLHKVDDSLRKF